MDINPLFFLIKLGTYTALNREKSNGLSNMNYKFPPISSVLYQKHFKLASQKS